MDLQALRERFRDQMPGLAEFDELATAYAQLMAAHSGLAQKWDQASPARVQELERTIEEMTKDRDAAAEGTKPVDATVLGQG